MNLRRKKLKNLGTIGLIGLGLAGILSNYNCSSTKDVAVGENEYYFEDLNLSQVGKKYINFNNSLPDSIKILYTDSIGREEIENESKENFKRFDLTIPAKNYDSWNNKINQKNGISFKAKRKNNDSFEIYKIYKKTIDIK